MQAHTTALHALTTQITNFHSTQTPFRIYHGSTNSTRHISLDPSRVVDTSALNNVLSIDTEKMTALVEPNVPMDALLDATMTKGLLPPVVMEFPGITVGGGVVGTGGESSSFRYGMFDRTVRRVEMVLGDGRVVWTSENENPELFKGLRGSFGTLGVVTAVEVGLVEMKGFVEVRYHYVRGAEGAGVKIREETELEKNDYVDGILYGKSDGVVITGRLSDEPGNGERVQRFMRARNPWFYLHAEKMMKKSKGSEKGLPATEYVPIKDYLFRYDRGAFWTGRYAFKYFHIPFDRVSRFVLNRFMNTRTMYHALHASGMSDQYIIQDLALPAKNIKKFLEYIDANFGLYPLWLCPLRKDAKYSFGPSRKYGEEDDMWMNIGLWGPGPSSPKKYLEVNRNLEARLRELGGLKWLYSKTFYTEEEFWEIYDREKCDELREKYNATNMPTIYDKTKGSSTSKESSRKEVGLRSRLRAFIRRTWFLKGLYGALKAWGGGDYLLARKNK